MNKKEIKEKLLKELEVLDESNGIVYKCPEDMLVKTIEAISDEDYEPRMLRHHYLYLNQGAKVEDAISELQKFPQGTLTWDEDDILVRHDPIQETEKEIYSRLYSNLWNELWPKVFIMYHNEYK